MSSVVLDASALLAFLHREPGSEVVRSKLSGSMMSAVNYAEVLKKLVENGASAEDARQQVDYLPVIIEAFDSVQAFETASSWPSTKAFGLSLGDRACLALGIMTGATVYTADRLMVETKLPVKVRLVRARN